jgi:hypothetical protein
MHDKPIILLFVKAPFKGRIKSRLAATIGDDAALELYQRFVLDTIAAARPLAVPLRICCYPPDAVALVRPWLGAELTYMPQQGNDLGERMGQAFAHVFHEGYDRAVLIGSDIPELSAAVLHEAMAALDSNDTVLGPAADGGYYLIGFTAKTFLPSVFQDIIWSTGTVCDETLGRLTRCGRRPHLLPKLHDIDTKDDLRSYFNKYRNDPGNSSHTLAYLIERQERVFGP